MAPRDKLITLPLRLGFRSVGPGRFNSPSVPWPNCRDKVKQPPFANLFRRYLATDDSGQIPLAEEIIANSAVHLQCPSSSAPGPGGLCDVYLVGTCHFSQESCNEVEAVINYLKPQAVFLELCQGRVDALTEHNVEDSSVPTMGEMFNIWKYRYTDNENAGEEFRIAYEVARSYGARVYLGDRPFHITLDRISNKLTLWRMIKVLYDILFKSDISKFAGDIAEKSEGWEDELQLIKKELDSDDGLTFVLQEISKVFPAFVETFVAERDKYMSQALWRVARKHSSVVAIVGKAHLSGIKRNWMQPVESLP